MKNKKNMNQIRTQSEIQNQADQNLIIAERTELCYDVRREDPGVYGRLIVSNYRMKFIENGKRENPDEIFDSSSAPFGCIQTL